MHQFYPATMDADDGDAAEEPEKGKLVYGDDHLWIVLAVSAYVKETGEVALLDEEVTFYADGVPHEQRESASVLDHLKRALEYTRTHVGRHGLPLLGYADWNDTVNLPGDAESVFNACLYGQALRGDGVPVPAPRAHENAERLSGRSPGHDATSQRLRLGRRVVCPLLHRGRPAARLAAQLARKHLHQRPVLAGAGRASLPRTARTAPWTAVREQLNTRFGIKLSGPGYDGYDPQIGGVTTYPPGAKENGGIFLHANPWVMIAETMLGRGDRAYEYYCQINPARRNDDIDLFEVEPYCYPQNILGDEHPQFGLGRNSWLSGTASWTYQAATQYILGIRPDHDGLVIDPCVPEQWESFEVVRRFRGADYRIRVSNPARVSSGVVRMTVDGREIDGASVPLLGPGEHLVEVELGPTGGTARSRPVPESLQPAGDRPGGQRP